MATATDSIVLEEEIDPNYDPSEDEILEYAKWLGFDLEGDKDLLYIAKEGATASLPCNAEGAASAGYTALWLP
jgi:centrosomal protein CEP164